MYTQLFDPEAKRTFVVGMDQLETKCKEHLMGKEQGEWRVP